MATANTTASADPIAILMQALGSKTTNTSESQTTSQNMPQQITDLITGLMQQAQTSGANNDTNINDIITKAAQAFAPLQAQQSGAGAYNSATTELLRGNAMAEAVKQGLIAKQNAAQDALKIQTNLAQLLQQGNQSTTVTRQGTTQPAGGMDPMKALLAAGATSILGGIGKKAAQAGGSVLNDLGGKAWDAAFGGSAVPDSSNLMDMAPSTASSLGSTASLFGGGGDNGVSLSDAGASAFKDAGDWGNVFSGAGNLGTDAGSAINVGDIFGGGGGGIDYGSIGADVGGYVPEGDWGFGGDLAGQAKNVLDNLF